jgi:AcrR family transcriptional regulator
VSTQKRQRGRPPISDDGSILDAVTDTFWRQGYTETSIGDLAAASGASRASLYKLYGDKHALIVAALERYADRFDARVGATLGQTTDPLVAVGATLRASADRLTDPGEPGGCLRCRVTLEIGDRVKVIGQALDRINASFEANMRRLLDADGLKRPTDPATARLLTACVNGMVVMSEAGAGRAVLEDVVLGALDVVRSRL